MQKKQLFLRSALLLALSTSFGICNAAGTTDSAAATDWTAAISSINQQNQSGFSSEMPPGAPPDGSTPPGPPPNGQGAPGQQETQSADALSAVCTIDKTTKNIYQQTIAATKSDENAVLVRNGGTLTMTDSILKKTGDSSNTEDSNFTGRNAVLLVNNSQATVSNTTLDSAAEGANALFSTGKNSTITADHLKIHTTKGSSRGLDATYGGTITASDIEITTEGAHCAALATDRGEGTVTVTRGIFSTAGDGSPCIYSTGNIKAINSKGVSTGSEIAVVEGKNSITLESTQLTGNKKHGIMLYQSFSGDAGTGTASFTAKNSKLTNLSTGPMFYVTNTKAIAFLENTVLDSNGTVLVQVTSDRWGRTGANGATFTLQTQSQQLTGDILANNLSSINLEFSKNTVWKGALNKDNADHMANIHLAADACWELTADSYISTLEDAADDFHNIKSNGHTIYYDTTSATNLKGQTYALTDGGKLTPKE